MAVLSRVVLGRTVLGRAVLGRAAVVLIGFTLFGCATPTEATPPTAAPEVAATGGDESCAVFRSQLRESSMSAGPVGYRGFEEWIANAQVRNARGAFVRRIDEQFGTSTKEVPFNQLSHGLIGTFHGNRAQEVVVVVDPRLVDIAGLNADFQNLAEVTPTNLTYRARAGCFSAERLVEAGEVIRARDWHPAASTTAYSGWFDPYPSMYRITFSPADRAVGEALKERLGDRVSIEYGEVMTKLPRTDVSGA